VREDLVSFIDFAPTMLALADIHFPMGGNRRTFRAGKFRR
jgi:hypothetical protein